MVGFRETSLSFWGQLPNFQGRTQAGRDQEATYGTRVPLMAETLAWHVCGRGPKRGRADDPSAREHFNSTIALFEVTSLAAAAGVPVTLRHDDTVNPVQFAAATGGAWSEHCHHCRSFDCGGGSVEW